jgi:hypothetical protein
MVACELQKQQFVLRVPKVRWAGDRCAVCDSDVDFDSDQLVSCDACGLTVHQSCYGVPDLPGEDDMWLCRPCELKVRWRLYGGRGAVADRGRASQTALVHQ